MLPPEQTYQNNKPSHSFHNEEQIKNSTSITLCSWKLQQSSESYKAALHLRPFLPTLFVIWETVSYQIGATSATIWNYALCEHMSNYKIPVLYHDHSHEITKCNTFEARLSARFFWLGCQYTHRTKHSPCRWFNDEFANEVVRSRLEGFSPWVIRMPSGAMRGESSNMLPYLGWLILKTTWLSHSFSIWQEEIFTKCDCWKQTNTNTALSQSRRQKVKAIISELDILANFCRVSWCTVKLE